MTHKFAIIPAGGTGSRHGGSLPKQFVDLDGRPMLWWTIHRFLEEDPSTNIILVIHPEHLATWEQLLAKMPEGDRPAFHATTGGVTRTESVRNGLQMMCEICESKQIDLACCKVAVHDAARPVVPVVVIRECWQQAAPGVGAIPVIGVTSSLRRVVAEANCTGIGLTEMKSQPVDRSEYYEVQTPQTFFATDLLVAYAKAEEGTFTDDASLAEQAGINIKMVQGSPLNIKVTNPQDSIVATLLMKLYKADS